MEKHELLEVNLLIHEIAQGNQRALVLLYEKIGARIFSIARGIVKDYALAEDVIQNCLIKLVKNATSFKKSDNGYGWVCTIVRNESYDLLRSRKIEYDIADYYNLADQSSNINPIKIEVNMALEKLEANDRTLIWMKYMLDMTIREIAQKLNMSKSNVALKILKAEKKLKELLSVADRTD